eukprot:6489049-Alexandrium_andersonii.AAC.1
MEIIALSRWRFKRSQMGTRVDTYPSGRCPDERTFTGLYLPVHDPIQANADSWLAWPKKAMLRA